MGNGWLDLPAYKLTKKRFPKARGVNIEPIEKAMKKRVVLRPIGVALEKEFGKRISTKEYYEKAMVGKGKRKGINVESLGLQGVLMRVNKQIKKQIKKSPQ